MNELLRKEAESCTCVSQQSSSTGEMWKWENDSGSPPHSKEKSLYEEAAYGYIQMLQTGRSLYHKQGSDA